MWAQGPVQTGLSSHFDLQFNQFTHFTDFSFFLTFEKHDHVITSLLIVADCKIYDIEHVLDDF